MKWLTYCCLKEILQNGVLLFWGCWFTLVFCADLIDFLQQKNILSKEIIFSSKNFLLLTKSLAVYSIKSSFLRLVLFAFITIWAGITAGAFWLALFSFSPIHFTAVNIAFILSLSMSAAFMIAHEIFMQYELEHSLINRFTFQLVTLLVFYKL